MHRPYLYHARRRSSLFVLFGAAYLPAAEPRYRLADQVPDREQALDATGRIDQKLTGANPVHVMIEWNDGTPLYSAEAARGHRPRCTRSWRRRPGLGNVWSLESLRRWLKEAGDDSIETVQKYVGYPARASRAPLHRQGAERRAGDRATARRRLEPDPARGGEDRPRARPIRKQLSRLSRISVTGLPAIAARNSARMIDQLNEACRSAWPSPRVLLASRSARCSSALVSLLPGLFPVVASGAILWAKGGGLEFASVVALLVVFGLAIDALIHFFNRLSLEERKEPTRRPRHPACARAGGASHHPDHAGAGVRARRDGVLRPAVAAHCSASCAAPRWWPRCWPTSYSCLRSSCWCARCGSTRLSGR